MHKISSVDFLAIHNEHMQDYYKLLIGKEMTNRRPEKGFEKHHIIPRAFGGTDEHSNLVKLTIYEHILAHYYLALGTKNVHMFHAFNCIMGKQYKALSDLEKIKLEELEHWAQIREQARQRMFSVEGRVTISEKTKARWQRFRESGRIEEVKKNISKTTAEGMASSKKSQIRTRVNLGCKKYWNPETGEQRNWYPGMPEFEAPWVRGRRPLSEESLNKLRTTLNKDPHKWYYNDELKINRTFKASETVPEGWHPGAKREYRHNYKKQKRQKMVDKMQELLNS